MNTIRPSVVGAFVRRDWLIARSYRLPFVLNVVGSMFIVLPLFQVSKLIPHSAAGHDPQLGHGYFAFALVGSMALFAGAGALRAFATGLREQQATGTLEALLATPLSPTAIILGSAVYEVLVGTLVMFVVLGVGIALGIDVDWSAGPLVASLAALGGLMLAFVALGVAVAAFTLVFKRGTAIVGLATTALALLADIWYPTSTLPHGVAALANALPVTWEVKALRSSLLFGHVDVTYLVAGIAVGLASVVAALMLFRLAVDHVRRHGALGQY